MRWVKKLFRRASVLDVLVEQLDASETSLAEHEQAENFSRAMVGYHRAEIARLRARIAAATTAKKGEAEPPANSPRSA